MLAFVPAGAGAEAAARAAANFGAGPQAAGTDAAPAAGPDLGHGIVELEEFEGSPGGTFSVLYTAPDWSPAVKRRRIDAPAPSWPVCHYCEYFFYFILIVFFF